MINWEPAMDREALHAVNQDGSDYFIVHTFDGYWTAYVEGRIILKDKDPEQAKCRFECWCMERCEKPNE